MQGHRRSAVPAAAIGLVAASLACSETPPAAAGRVETDSAGVHIVEYPPVDGTVGLAREEVLRLGVAEGADEVMFSTIIGGLILPDGSIVVADRGASEIRRFSREGELLSRHGREGEGPGEFQYIRELARCRPTGFSVFDIDWTLHRYDDEGRFVDQRRPTLDDGRSPYQLACSRSGRLAVTNWEDLSQGVPQGLYTATTRLRILGPEGDEQVDLGERIGSERFGRPTGTGPHPFGASTHVAFDGEDLIVADGTFFGYERWSPGGRLTGIVRVDVPPPSLDSLLDGYREVLLARASDDAARRRTREYVEMLRPLERAAHFRDLRVLGGRVLVQTQAPDESGPWFVFGRDGTPQGWLELPDRATLLDMTDESLLVAVRDELDIARVVLYDIEPRGAAASSRPPG